MSEAHAQAFTRHDVWSGGHYELLIVPSIGSSEQLCSLLSALWSFPSLDGCYVRNDLDPSAQTRLTPCENDASVRLYGLATLPNDIPVACGSYAMDYAGEDGSTPAHWISFFFPLGALSSACEVGAYPFGDMDKASEWKTLIDAFLVEVARWTFRRVQFQFGLIGFEVDVDAVSPLSIITNGVPGERGDGILWNDGGELRWYSSTRP